MSGKVTSTTSIWILLGQDKVAHRPVVHIDHAAVVNGEDKMTHLGLGQLQREESERDMKLLEIK